MMKTLEERVSDLEVLFGSLQRENASQMNSSIESEFYTVEKVHTDYKTRKANWNKVVQKYLN